MGKRYHPAAKFVRYDDNDRYECALCGWPVTHIGGNRFKHVANGESGPAPCGGYPERVAPRGWYRAAVRRALGEGYL